MFASPAVGVIVNGALNDALRPEGGDGDESEPAAPDVQVAALNLYRFVLMRDTQNTTALLDDASMQRRRQELGPLLQRVQSNARTLTSAAPGPAAPPPPAGQPTPASAAPPLPRASWPGATKEPCRTVAKTLSA